MHGHHTTTKYFQYDSLLNQTINFSPSWQENTICATTKTLKVFMVQTFSALPISSYLKMTMKGVDDHNIMSHSWCTKLQMNQHELPSLLQHSLIVDKPTVGYISELKSTSWAKECNTRNKLACLQLLLHRNYISVRVHNINTWLHLLCKNPL